MSRLALRIAALATLVVQAGAGVAQGAPTWLRSAAPDGSFSAETSCSKAEVDGAAVLPARIVPGVEFAPEKRVVCFKNGMMFVAGVTDASFDALVAEVGSDPTTEGTPKAATIDGRRAYLNREVRGDQLAQTGFVELSPTQLVLFISGVQNGTALSLADQEKMSDRFTASIRLGGARK